MYDVCDVCMRVCLFVCSVEESHHCQSFQPTTTNYGRGSFILVVFVSPSNLNSQFEQQGAFWWIVCVCVCVCVVRLWMCDIKIIVLHYLKNADGDGKRNNSVGARIIERFIE